MASRQMAGVALQSWSDRFRRSRVHWSFADHAHFMQSMNPDGGVGSGFGSLRFQRRSDP